MMEWQISDQDIQAVEEILLPQIMYNKLRKLKRAKKKT